MSTFALIWDVSRSNKLAWLRYKPAAIDKAISMGGPSSLDGNGVSFVLMPAPEYLVFFGTPPQPRPPMGPAVGAGAALVNWSATNVLTTDQTKCVAEFRNIFLDGVPQELLVPMQDANRSIRLRSTEYIFTRLSEELGTLDKEDLDFLMGELRKPYMRGTSVSTFLANWQADLRDSARAGQALPQTMATDMLKTCFGSEFQPCWVTFVQNYPLVANRTVELLAAAIITFSKDTLPLLAAHSAIGISEVINQKDELNKMQEQIDQLKHQALSANERKRGQASGSGQAAKQPRAALSTRPFCWSHGPQGHLGCSCTKELPGHKSDATWANQKGSKWKELFASRGWSTT